MRLQAFLAPSELELWQASFDHVATTTRHESTWPSSPALIPAHTPMLLDMGGDRCIAAASGPVHMRHKIATLFNSQRGSEKWYQFVNKTYGGAPTPPTLSTDREDDGAIGEASSAAADSAEDVGESGGVPVLVPRHHHVLLALQEPRVLTGYTVMAGNDCPSRDPSSWTILGLAAVHPRPEWVVLDVRASVAFTRRRETKTFPRSGEEQLVLPNTRIFALCLRIDSICSDGRSGVQLAQWIPHLR